MPQMTVTSVTFLKSGGGASVASAVDPTRQIETLRSLPEAGTPPNLAAKSPPPQNNTSCRLFYHTEAARFAAKTRYEPYSLTFVAGRDISSTGHPIEDHNPPNAMALGILEPAEHNVPGTVDVYDEQRRQDEHLQVNTTLKRDKTGKIILNPQPSDDPNDPLNWPLWQRDTILGLLCFVAVCATTASPLLAADSVTMALVFERTFQDAAWLTAYHLCGVGVGAVIAVPFARVFGKRGLFLFGALLMCAASAWGGSTRKDHHYASMVWARVVQGVALAPFESLVNAVVGDLYFVTERGPRMAIVNVCLFGGAFLTPVIVGSIVVNPHMGWPWSFYLLSIFMGVGFLLLFFCVPETAYKRPNYLETDLILTAPTAPANSSPLLDSRSSNENDNEKEARTATLADPIPTSRDSYLKRLSPYNGRKTDDSFFKLFLRPFPLFAHPAVIWACLMQGVIIGWTVMIGVIISLIFLGPPLFFSEYETGKIYVAAFIGSIIGLFLSGIYTEVVTRFMVRRNGGRYEPEFRILLVIPTLIFTAVGLYGFGITAAHVARYGYIVPCVFLAFVIISMVMGAIASAQYVLDAHRDISVEAFTNMIIFKNIFSFILAYFCYSWIFSGGTQRMFIIFASIEVGICLLSIPMYVFGKKNRLYFHQHDLLSMARLR